tara:strand:+ start:1143 stop:2066 length:924 start_codon:yes stop_codon:yes gene_type:complete
MNEPIIIAVIGMGYNGSTILNFIFDTHSKIYGGGELHWLTKANAEPFPDDWRCTECGEDCRYWTSERILSCTYENIHITASSIFNVNVVVDTSKNVDWFIPKIRNKKISVIPVLLVKHPLRHLASFVSLRTKQDYSVYSKWKKFKMKVKRQSPEEEIVDTYINYMNWYYRSGVEDVIDSSGFMTLKYEDVVLDTEKAISPILSACGLTFETEMLLPFANDHHQIGGNTGPVYLKSGKWVGNSDLSHKNRLEHYEAVKINNEKKRDSLLFLDNKYEKVLTHKQIDKIVKDKRYRWLCDRLNYVYDPRL